MTSISPVTSHVDLVALNPSEHNVAQRSSPNLANASASSIASLGGQTEDLNTSIAPEVGPLVNYVQADNAGEALDALGQMGDAEMQQIAEAIQQREGISGDGEVSAFIRSQPQSPVIAETVQDILHQRLTPPPAEPSSSGQGVVACMVKTLSSLFSSLGEWLKNLCCCFAQKQEGQSGVIETEVGELITLMENVGDVSTVAQGERAATPQGQAELNSEDARELEERPLEQENQSFVRQDAVHSEEGVDA